MEKYYIPKIEEFHPGFEYQESLKNDGKWNWEDQVVEIVYDFNYYNNQIESENIRVKYLDKEDIESLGWELHHQLRDGGSLFFTLPNNLNWTLHTHIHYPQKIEIRHKHPSWEYGGFLGIIKNKSKLKDVLKMIGV